MDDLEWLAAHCRNSEGAITPEEVLADLATTNAERAAAGLGLLGVKEFLTERLAAAIERIWLEKGLPPRSFNEIAELIDDVDGRSRRAGRCHRSSPSP